MIPASFGLSAFNPGYVTYPPLVKGTGSIPDPPAQASYAAYDLFGGPTVLETGPTPGGYSLLRVVVANVNASGAALPDLDVVLLAATTPPIPDGTNVPTFPTDLVSYATVIPNSDFIDAPYTNATAHLYRPVTPVPFLVGPPDTSPELSILLVSSGAILSFTPSDFTIAVSIFTQRCSTGVGDPGT